MDGDRQTARTADEEARRLIREWRHGRFDENDPYSRLAADFRSRLKTSEASFCEAKTKTKGSLHSERLPENHTPPFSDDLRPANPQQTAPSPVGEGWGEGILQIAAIFPTPKSPKYKPCGLLPSL